MARLDFQVTIRSRHTKIPGQPWPNGPGYGTMGLTIFYGVKGTPQYNLNGAGWTTIQGSGNGSPNYFVMWELQTSPLIVGYNTLQYRDDNGERTIGGFRIYDLNEGCRYTRSTGIGNVQYPLDPTINVRDYNVEFSYIDPGGVDIEYSINDDGSGPWRGNLNKAVWTIDELEALGITDAVPAVWIRNKATLCANKSAYGVLIEQIRQYDPLAATATVSDVTVAGGSDGTITVSVSGGSGSYTVSWADDPTTSLFRSNLPKGTYTVTITDTITAEVVTLIIDVEEPEIVLRVGTFFDVPMMNSMRWVVNPVKNHDNISTFQNTRNTLFRDMVYPGFRCTDYAEKRIIGDLHTEQWWSDYPMHSVDMFDYHTNEVVRSFGSGFLKEKNVGIPISASIVLRNDFGNLGRSRVYFQSGMLALPLQVGDYFEVTNNLDGMDGTYAIVDIQIDPTLNYQYLVINKSYTAPTPNSNATGIFQENRTDYDVYEINIDFSGLPEGEYYVRIQAIDDLNNEQRAITEPQELRLTQPKTVLLEYRNTDNSFDMTWQTGIICMMRIPGVLFEEQTGGTRSVSRESDYSLRKVSAKKTHILTFNTYMLPPWLHVKLGVIFDLDFWYLNKVEYQTEEDYEKPKYIDQYKLANSSIDIEEVQFFRKTNSRGVSVLDGGFITHEQGYIKR
jgi:hypothetical protein